MSVKLVRANSDTPNIQNNDDCRLFRYACGGYDGIVKGFGNELNYEISGSNFIVKSGEFVIDGWQGKIDGSGVSIAVDNLGGIQYYVVYAEIDLSVSANQKAEIKATYNTAYYPTISRGDDLTTTPSGVARIELYRFEASSGVISNVQQRFRVLDYGWTKNSENLSGTIESGVLAVTQATSDNSRKVATTEFAQNLVNTIRTQMHQSGVGKGSYGSLKLDNGLILKWGFARTPSGASRNTVSFDNTYPFTQVYSIFVTPIDTGNTVSLQNRFVRITSYDNTQFAYIVYSDRVDCMYFVIGI